VKDEKPLGHMFCIWSIIFRGFLTSCEAELQELMKQIDIMVAHKKSEWEGQTHALETCLDIRDRELKTLRSQLDMKHKEVEHLTLSFLDILTLTFILNVFLIC
jgi:hypothetical protein